MVLKSILKACSNMSSNFTFCVLSSYLPRHRCPISVALGLGGFGAQAFGGADGLPGPAAVVEVAEAWPSGHSFM